ncbi:MAG: hypothetical protein BWY85_00367 [Firmicutes bacterium ADurb.Bin506]|nr:MAG: hypothetical protein BWY85_00367 [Firmicutes bacterium ADurb.Bin506]
MQCANPSDAGRKQQPVMGESRVGRTLEPTYTYAPIKVSSCEIRIGNAVPTVGAALPPTTTESGDRKR